MNSCLLGLIERGLEKKVPAIGLGLFRIFFGLVILQEIVYLVYFRHLIFDKIPFMETANPIVSFALGGWLLAAVFLIFGLFTSAFAVANYVFWVVFVLLTPMWRDFDGGFDQLMTSSSLILIFVHPERRFSLDTLRLQLKFAGLAPTLVQDTRLPVIFYYLLAGVSLGLLYFDAALHKFQSEIWMNGLGVWVPNTMPYYISPFDFDWFVNNRRLQELSGYSLFVFQLSFLFIFTRRLFRIPLLIFGLLFHLGIIFCLNIYPFGFGMLVHYILLVPFKWWTFIARKIEHNSPVLHTYCNITDRCSLRIALILRHFDFRNFAKFEFVSKPDELPEIIRNAHPDFHSFSTASLDRQHKKYEGLDGFLEKKYFCAVLLFLRFFDFVEFRFCRCPAIFFVCSTRFAGLSKRTRTILSSRFASRKLSDTKVPPSKAIYRFLAFVLILQLNSTVYYGLLKRFPFNERPTVQGQMISEVSIYVTSISHILFGITPHALYMDEHFSGYEQIVALTYIDSAGHENWVPFIAPDGRFVSPNWGRVHSMWANVAMHPPFNPIVFERLTKKVTAFWAEKLGIGTRDSTFIIKTKPVQISYRWINDLRKKNLGGYWSEFGTIRWIEGQFSIHYGSRSL
ncbi:MAG: DCC1-like thiol-disulfide oxidoreductase family protein [Methylococcales bacterium]